MSPAGPGAHGPARRGACRRAGLRGALPAALGTAAALTTAALTTAALTAAALTAGAWTCLALSPAAGTARADMLVLESGKSAKGAAFRAADEVRLNTFGCTAAEMTLGVRVFRARDVRRIDPDEDEAWIVTQLDGLLEASPAEALPELVRLAGLARRKGYRDLARRLGEEALLRGSTDAEVLKGLGGAAKWAERRRGDLRLNPALADGLAALLLLERGSARQQAAQRLAREHGLTLDPDLVERLAAALDEPVGDVEEVPLAWRAAETPAGTYTLRVPLDVHPLEPRALVLALHGGGLLARPDGTQALGGTGRDMLRLLGDGAERLGWLLLCPTAVEAPWDTPRNRAFLQALLEEVTGRFNVDLNRVHVIGLGEGGAGAYALANAWPERFASVGAAGAAAPTTASALLSRRLGLWIAHGEADTVEPVDPVRKLAQRLGEQHPDFVYCELPKEGHGIAAAAERDWYRFAQGRRNPRAQDAWPQPSLARPVSALERLARGEPAAAWGQSLSVEAPDEALWAALAAGQRSADPACERLWQRRPHDLVERASALVRDPRAPTAARGYAAWLLGEAGDRSAARVLGDALRATDGPWLRLRLARAVKRLASPENREDLRATLQEVTSRYQRATFAGSGVPFQAYQGAAQTVAEVVEALALVGPAEDLVGDIEQSVVLGLLRDARPVDRRSGPGGDPQGVRLSLVRSVARAYKTLKAEPTLVEMLRTVVKKDPQALAAVAQGLGEGVPR